MKKFLLLFISILTFANPFNINSFEADFTQTILDEAGKKITYNGHLKAMQPHYALWSYEKPIKKDVYINNNQIVIIEPELEQAIIKRIESKFNFFALLSQAKKVNNFTYTTNFMDTKFTIILQKDLKIKTIFYLDDFENNTTINFTNQKTDIEIPQDLFEPSIPIDYDTIL